MASRALRPSLTARTCLPRLVRSMYTAPGSEMTLRSQDDWRFMQENRARFKLLYDLFSEHGSTQTRENTYQPHHAYTRAVGPSHATVSALIAAGAHLGHTRSLMNPNFLPYAFGVRAGLTVIDLDQTVPLLRRAANVARAIAQRGGTILFVGTRPDLRDIVRHAASKLGEQGYHIGERWLPGILTNRRQLFSSASQQYLITPDLVIFLNPMANVNAIRECAIQHIPTVGIVDSNVDPRIVMYPIPANDESPRTAQLVSGVLSIAGREGILARQGGRRRRSVKETGG
ncbi:ribosomal protein S2, flavodoxin-like domain-containing protein [Boletus edulis BED1]|uniref:Ribosomal protein S2, flavodoxin-like domain-containing protein n=1 Tax=Boletus edulis BED1 TaxID=1328754 RepID=A0AAD4GKN1_BOLED|nr:ribosomal protein S2, flavodoxin-like domain-containing protein [Boletus edulis BED1]